MKYAIIFASFAAVAFALPQGGPNTGQKLPWTAGSNFRADCGWWGWDEKGCGTEKYCDAIDEQAPNLSDFDNGKPRYKSTKECFDAHDPAPWTEGSNFSADCGWWGWDEKGCGTKKYCDAIDEQAPNLSGFDNGKPRYKSTKECFDAHQPDPSLRDRTRK
ncbi:hypothetical protein HRG_007135 [Hirsutella rhossiliensis]|uniref:Uncharacterized protein n=1 Tax=Hirsutella rhossiliensis TaxID=111463 RepID=A0A9P8MVL4_9HYPO|nr:uncharacterized protein HRG_07135 [Hirsutella rhossiliensis]KAH0962055.1 hypothetical protein HRG_07135 [Hirsutella rhossiliensis]